MANARNFNENKQDLFRVRSFNSDENQTFFDEEKAIVLQNMGIISNDELWEAKKTGNFSKLVAKVNVFDNIRRQQFDVLFANKIVKEKDLLEKATPNLLADAYLSLNSLEEIDNKKIVETQIDKLSEDMQTQSACYYADFTNVCDAYDGYNRMFDVRKETLHPVKEADKIKTIVENKKTLNLLVEEYDEVWGLDNIEPKDAFVVNRTFRNNSRLMKSIKPSKDVMSVISKYQFLDKNGFVEKQFDEKGNLKKKSKLNDVIKLAKADVVFKSLGQKKNLDKFDAVERLNVEVTSKLFTIHNVEEVLRDATSEPIDKFSNPKYARAFWFKVQNIKKPLKISHEGFVAAMKTQANAVKGFQNRLVQKMGGDNKQAHKNQWKNIGLSAGIFAATGAAITLATAYTAAHTAASGLAVTGVAMAAGLAMSARQIYMRKKQADIEGTRYGFKEFLKDRPLRNTVITTALGAGALAMAASGNVAMAGVLGYGAVGYGAASGAQSSYLQARKDGLSKGWASFYGAMKGLSTAGSALLGKVGADAIINGNDTFITTTEQRHFSNATEAYDATNAEHKAQTFVDDNGRTITRSLELNTAYSQEAIEATKNVINNEWYANPEGQAKLAEFKASVAEYNTTNDENIMTERFLRVGHSVTSVATPNATEMAAGAETYMEDVRRLVNLEHIQKQVPEATQADINAYAEALKTGEITPEAIKAFKMLDAEFSAKGHWNGEPYGEHGSAFVTEGKVVDIIEETITTKTQEEGIVGVFGWASSFVSKTKSRIGALLDKVIKKSNVDDGIKEPANDSNQELVSSEAVERNIADSISEIIEKPANDVANIEKETEKSSNVETIRSTKPVVFQRVNNIDKKPVEITQRTFVMMKKARGF